MPCCSGRPIWLLFSRLFTPPRPIPHHRHSHHHSLQSATALICLSDFLLPSSTTCSVVFAKHVKVKLLVAYWTHTLAGTIEHLVALNYTNKLCASSNGKCRGNVEIKFFEVPGFEATGPKIKNGLETGNLYPGYTRVVHGKYVVSDVRAHIGTSNLVWDYFYTTAGLSLGTYNAALVSQLQAIFDADWISPYAVPLQDTPV